MYPWSPNVGFEVNYTRVWVPTASSMTLDLPSLNLSILTFKISIIMTPFQTTIGLLEGLNEFMHKKFRVLADQSLCPVHDSWQHYISILGPPCSVLSHTGSMWPVPTIGMTRPFNSSHLHGRVQRWNMIVPGKRGSSKHVNPQTMHPSAWGPRDFLYHFSCLGPYFKTH